jgi:hypothetical protein
LGAGFVDGTVAPQLVDQHAPGDTIGFGYSAPLSYAVTPRENSNVIVIETDAASFQAGNLNIIDGGVTTVAAYEPAGPSTVPEPNFLLLLSIGLLALTGFRQFAKVR